MKKLNLTVGKKSSAAELRELFINRALKDAGYTARANGVSIYGTQVGAAGSNIPWDGAFIDVIAAESGVPLFSHLHTSTALSEYVRTNRFYTKPKRGDIVFFTFPADPSHTFNGPHVGIVLNTKGYESDRSFVTLEAQTSSGLPKATDLHDGVYKRLRYQTDVIGFGRPTFNETVKPSAASGGGAIPTKQQISSSKVLEASHQAKSTLRAKPSKHVATVQLALFAKLGAQGMVNGVWCPATRSAFARYQRLKGLTGEQANGVPVKSLLIALGHETKLFNVR